MYEIKILEDKDFTKAMKSDPRYSYVDETNLGFADRVKGIAYVRKTVSPDLNKYLIFHELEELEESHSTHEDKNGIRHKKGGFFKNLFDPVGLFHAGNLLGIGPNQGKAGIGQIPGMNMAGAAIGNLIGGPFGGMAGAGLQGAGNKLFGGFEGNQPSQQAQDQGRFGGLDFGIPGSSQNQQNYASPASPFSDQQSSSQGGFNQGLNSNSINPLTDTSNPYDRYGQQQGRYKNISFGG